MDVNRICAGCMRELGNDLEYCPYCGFKRSQNIEVGHHLRPYSILNGKYLVGKVLGEGGFGITYIGMDINLEMRVAIKEFYPNGYVTRESSVTSMITDYQGPNAESIKKWKESFIREARSLAKCSNLQGIVGVKDFFEENNTAYIIMEYLDGITIKTYLKDNNGRLPVNDVLQIMKPIILSLEEVHKQGLIHRDISPDNIMMMSGNTVKLLDFGAARNFINDNEKSLSVMLKPGYAPEEQYRTKGKQGPWSDVYALCATIYKCITGVTPLESMERMRSDELKRPSEVGIAIDSKVEQVLMKGLAVYAEQRIQSMNELFEQLYNLPRMQTAIPMNTQTITQVTTMGSNSVQTYAEHPSETGKLFERLNSISDQQRNIIIVTMVGITILLCFVIGIAGKKLSRNEQVVETMVAVEQTATNEISNSVEKAEPVKESVESVTDEEEICEKDTAVEETVKNYRYEFYIEDLTWMEAFNACSDKGGRLVTFENREEYDSVLKMLEEQEFEDYIFYIGAARPIDSYDYHWMNADMTATSDVINTEQYAEYWFPGEPSYEGDDGEEERYVDIFYSKKFSKWLWNDIPNDILAVIPSYSGKVGYICEFEE